MVGVAPGFRVFEALIDFSPPVLDMGNRMHFLGSSISSFKEPLRKAVKDVVIPSFETNFAVGGRPAWEPLSDYTLERRSNAGTGSQILVEHGQLYYYATHAQAWTYDDQEGEAWIQTSKLGAAFYGEVHQWGGYAGSVFIPQREWAVFQEEDANRIGEVFEEWLDDRTSAELA